MGASAIDVNEKVSARRARLGARTHHARVSLDPLEPRTLLTAYTPTALIDEYAIPDAVLFSLNAAPGTSGFGAAAAVLGDLDADGADDFAVSAPGANDPAVVNGVVTVYSGRTRVVLSAILGDTPGFGAVLVAAGDVDGDGRTDLFIGTPDAARGAIYSARNGAQLRSFVGDPGSEFGFSFAAIDDVDRDGSNDFAIGAPSQDGRGTVFLLSGDDGTTIRRFDSDQAGSRFGHALIVYLDVRADWPDGEFDGIREIVIGAPQYDRPSGGQPVIDSGQAYLFNPSDGVGAAINQDPYAHGQVGFSLALAGRAIMVGAPNPTSDPEFHAGGWVYRTDGAHLGTPQITSHDPGTRLGWSLAGVPAIDGSDAIDLLVGRGAGTIASYRLDSNDYPSPAPVSTFDGAAALAGDFDGDTISDTLVLRALNSPPVVGRSLFSFRSVPGITGFSANGEYVLSAGDTSVALGGFPFIATHDTFIPLRTIPELAAHLSHVRLTAVSNDGMAAGYFTGSGDPFFIDLAVPSQVNLMSELTLNVEGPAYERTSMRIVAFGPTGDALIVEPFNGSARAWILSGDRLTYMFEGLPSDQRADGTVMGVHYEGGPGEAVLWTRQGGVSPLPGLRDVWKFNPDGSILARGANRDLVVLRDGVATRIRGDGSWHPVGIDSAGRVIAQDGSQPTTSFVDLRGFPYTLLENIEPHLAPAERFGLDGVEYRPMEALRFDTGPRTVILLLPDGRIITPTHVLTPVGGPGQVDANGSVRAAAGTSAPSVVARMLNGMPFGLTLAPGGDWAITPYAAIDRLTSFASYTDPKDGGVYVVAFGHQILPDGSGARGVVYRQLDDGSLVDPQAILFDQSLEIVSRVVTFTATDQRVHVVGKNAAGDVVMFYQTGSTLSGGGFEWSLDNISANHLDPQSFATPSWVGGLTAYVAPWNGLNIAGIDAEGQIRVIWWAPGQTLWSAANLSAITGMPALDRSVTSYVTPWGGLNVAGIDDNGDLQVAWWVPGFGADWRRSNMTEEFAGAKLSNAAAFVNAWGGLNIAGLEAETNTPVVYWWAPTMIDWISEPIPVTGEPSPTDWASNTPLVPVVRGQEQNLIGASTAGDVLRLSWIPGDGLWTLDNLTELAI